MAYILISIGLIRRILYGGMWRTQITSPRVNCPTPCRCTILSRHFNILYHRNVKGQSDELPLPYLFDSTLVWKRCVLPFALLTIYRQSHTLRLTHRLPLASGRQSRFLMPCLERTVGGPVFMITWPEQAIVEDRSTCSLESGRFHRKT